MLLQDNPSRVNRRYSITNEFVSAGMGLHNNSKWYIAYLIIANSYLIGVVNDNACLLG